LQEALKEKHPLAFEHFYEDPNQKWQSKQIEERKRVEELQKAQAEKDQQ
jgi:hypothetical protein